MRYFISDLHFFHENIIKIDDRPFLSCQDMNEFMTDRWNSRVNVTDEVYVLGDFSLGTGDETNYLLDRLNGKKYLIVGNHDKYLSDKTFDRLKFKWIKPYFELREGNYRVILSHYPIFCYNGQHFIDESCKSNTFMLYGHVHDSSDERLIDRFIKETKQNVQMDNLGRTYNMPCNMINCFCVYSDYIPLSLGEWIELDVNRRLKI